MHGVKGSTTGVGVGVGTCIVGDDDDIDTGRDDGTIIDVDTVGTKEADEGRGVMVKEISISQFEPVNSFRQEHK